MSQTDAPHMPPTNRQAWAVFLIFLRLGVSSFGGPIAHLAYFRDEFVTRRAWLTDQRYAELVALCQFLPGPASSQVGMALGLSRAGYLGALAAWLGFTFPSAIGLIVLALGLAQFDMAGNSAAVGALHGLKIVAVAVVAQAIWGMASKLCVGALRASIMSLAACLVLFVPSAWSQVAAIGIAGIIGLLWIVPPAMQAGDPLPVPVSRQAGVCWLVLFFALLIGLPILVHIAPGQALAMIDAFYRAGALVFGGGHVVLPLLQAEVVPVGWVSNQTFLAGYGLAQAVPGPLFTFAAFLGAAMNVQPSGWLGGLLCLLAIFAPAFLLVAGALPSWAALRHSRRMQAALAGINAAVVGVLVAAFYDPVWTSAIGQPRDFALALLALLALMFWKLPPWVVVAGSAVAGALQAMVL